VAEATSTLTPLARRFFLGSLVGAALAVLAYARSLGTIVGGPSGRTGMGIFLGVLGTMAMAGAAVYSWRRRYIARASRSIEVDAERRKELLAREKQALAEVQALQRTLTRNPNRNPKEIRAEVKKTLRSHGVRRTIRVRVEGGAGKATRLVVERREWMGRLQTWYYWHLALGCLALVLILLHSGFRFGNVVATLAFVCLAGVVATGIVGVYLYWTVPPALTVIEERAERTPEELREELREVVRELEALADGKSDSFRSVFRQEMAIPGVSMKPSLRWLRPVRVDRDVSRPDRLRLVVKEINPEEQEDFRKAMRLIFRKEKIEVLLFPQLRYDYLMKVWLTAHIPLSVGMWAFSVVHIVSVGFF
jgi:F0F1-type ATP synthase membrane subunit b/b'